MTIEEFEQLVLGMLLAGDDSMLIALRAQYGTAAVTQRNLTGVGLYTHFAIPDETPHVTPATFVMQDVFLDLQGVENGAMAMLFVHGGVIDFLEVCTLTDAWPNELVLLSMYYISPNSGPAAKERDLKEVSVSYGRVKA